MGMRGGLIEEKGKHLREKLGRLEFGDLQWAIHSVELAGPAHDR
jgi:hypothetical protein